MTTGLYSRLSIATIADSMLQLQSTSVWDPCETQPHFTFKSTSLTSATSILYCMHCAVPNYTVLSRSFFPPKNYVDDDDGELYYKQRL